MNVKSTRLPDSVFPLQELTPAQTLARREEITSVLPPLTIFQMVGEQQPPEHVVYGKATLPSETVGILIQIHFS